MKGELLYGENNKVLNPASAYQPDDEVKDFTLMVRRAYEKGSEILNRPFDEFNGLSVIGRMNEDQKAWLSWNPAGSQDPEDDWRWFGVRPITRNKIISTAAHLTAQLIYPNIFAQNDRDEEDRDAAYVMKTLVEYNIQRSNYELAFLYGVISALVNPVTYFKVEFVEAFQEIWKDEKNKEKVIDDVFSGFQHSLIPCDEILIGNPYQFDLQKQPFLIHKRLISYDEAKGLYQDHENFKYVQKGKKTFLHSDGLFYDVDDVNGDLVEEVRYYSRHGDCEAPHVSGVYLGNKDPKYNPMRHRTNKGKPKYPFAKFGAEPVDAMRFFFYKSLAAKMSNDQELADRMWQMAMDGTFLATFPPILTMGAGKIDKGVVVPATVTNVSKDAKIEPLSVSSPVSAFTALREAERSLSESSQDPQLEGKSTPGSQTARESLLIQQNAETNLSLISKMIGNAVKDVGSLMVDDIIRYQTTGKVSEILGGVPKMKFKTFVTGGKVKEGRRVTEQIQFTDEFAGMEMTPDEKEKRELRMLTEAGDEKEIYKVNPSLFARMDYLVSVDYEQMMQKNSSFEKAFKLEVYDRSIANPYVDQQAVTRDFLMEPLVGGEASKYMKNLDGAQGVIPQAPEEVTKKGRIPQRMMASAAMQNIQV